jgi:hypothetical protein
MTIIQDISAGLTDYARELVARGLAEAVMLGDWSFQVGTYGFDPLAPDETYDVDFTQQTLTAPVGGTRYLGRVVDSGIGVSVALTATPGILQVNGLPSSTISMANKWLRLSGSTNPLLNGTWVVGARVSSTSVYISNPMVTTADAGPLSWELREAVCLRPNPRAIDFHGNIELIDATNGLELGEIGVFCRVLRAPSVPSLVGTGLMFAHAHHPAIAKFAEMSLGQHVCVQC